MTGVAVRAPAKINLHLGVGAPREDGFHPLATVYQAVGLYDDVTADAGRRTGRSPAPADSASTSTGVPLDGDQHRRPRAAALLADAPRRRPAGERAHRQGASRSPAGMAGGSADAAAALVALDRLWGLRTPPTRTCSSWPPQLGSDVPFALLGGTALGTGRGELVEPVPDARHLVVGRACRPGRACPPRRSTGEFDRLHPGAPAPTRRSRDDAARRAAPPATPRALAGALAQRPAGRRARPAPRARPNR